MRQWLLCVSLLLASFPGYAKLVKYDLTIAQMPVNLSGKKSVDFALAVNGTIPAPTLEFTEGDDAEIRVTNKIASGEEASIHWHGILLPPEMDGVAYVNTPPIFKDQSFTFRFKIRQHGTYWYHSHTKLQEQKGVYGAIVIHPKKPALAPDHDVVAVLSDWSDEDGDQILKNLKKDGDYYLYKKNSVRSYLGALKAGGLGTMLKHEWERMGGMDLSDVGYDAFLINGKRESQLVTAHPGETVRVRVINAGASSYFYLSLAGLPFQVVAADGVDVKPVWTKEILLGMAETYDILFTVPEHKNYELRATAQDVTGHASAWIGMGAKVPALGKPLPDLYAPMDHGSHAGAGDHANHAPNSEHSGHAAAPASPSPHDHAHHHGHGHAHGAPPPSPPSALASLTVDDLESPHSTSFPAGKKVHDVKLVLGGDMERYVWHINGKAIHEERTIEIREGEVIRFTLDNGTMMHHPMHLHGHFFRVLNKAGERSPLKHTVDVPPHGSRTIEFYADEPGQWMLHCHNLYHMKTGMARVVKYSSWEPTPEMKHLEHSDPHHHDHWYATAAAMLATNVVHLEARASQTWNQVEMRVEAKNPERNKIVTKGWEREADLFYRRWFNQYFSLVGGATHFADRERATVGAAYLLPLMLESQALVDHKGKFRVDLERKFQWTKNFLSEVGVKWRPAQDLEHDFEVDANLLFAPSWHWAVGITFTQESLGLGLRLLL